MDNSSITKNQILRTVQPDRNSLTKGIIYVVHGKRHLENAIISASSIRKVMPDIPITLFTSTETNSFAFDEIIRIEQKIHGASFFSPKVFEISNTPYDFSIYIDADTYICESFYELFDLLGKFDIAVAHDTFRTFTLDSEYLTERIQRIPNSFPMFNTGVIVFNKNQRIKKFFQRWEKIYKSNIEFISQHGGGYFGDQTPFREAIYESNLRIATLPTEYNCIFRHPVFLNGTAKILHGRYKNYETLQREINRFTGNRVFLMPYGIIHEYHRSSFIITKWFLIDKISNLNTAIKALIGKKLTLVKSSMVKIYFRFFKQK